MNVEDYLWGKLEKGFLGLKKTDSRLEYIINSGYYKAHIKNRFTDGLVLLFRIDLALIFTGLMISGIMILGLGYLLKKKDLFIKWLKTPRIARKKHNTAEIDCSICFSPIDKNEEIHDTCHHFHIECIELWYAKNQTCPLCRKPINLGKIAPVEQKCENSHRRVKRFSLQHAVVKRRFKTKQTRK